MIKIDFLPDDLAESLIPYDTNEPQVDENSGDFLNTNQRVEFVVRKTEEAYMPSSTIMPSIEEMSMVSNTGMLPMEEIAMAANTGMLPVEEIAMAANTGMLPVEEIAMAANTGILPVEEIAMAANTGMLPVDEIGSSAYSTGAEASLMASVMDTESDNSIGQELNASDSANKKRKRFNDESKAGIDNVKKKKVRRRISPSTMKESYVEVEEDANPDSNLRIEKTEKLTSSYVEKKSSPFKNKFKYTVIVVPENTKGHFRPVYLGYTLVNVMLGILLTLLVLLTISNTVRGFKLKSLKAENNKMQETIDSMETNMVYLTSANAGLSDKVAVLSETVNQKSGELENYVKDEESKMTPTGFPFAGQAAMLESTETAKESKITLGGESESKKNSERKPGYDLEGYPITIFSASKGTKIIATANGKVKEVAADLCFGNRIAIEHSNGMVSIYRCSSTPKVSEKQDVKQGDTLYETEGESEKLGYQIIKDSGYIDPLEMMEIFG